MNQPIEYPKHDRKLTFDLLDNLARSGTNHDHDQPSHLVIKTEKASSPAKSLRTYSAPEERLVLHYLGSALQRFMSSWMIRREGKLSRSMPRTASTAKPAQSKWWTNTSSGGLPRETGGPNSIFASTKQPYVICPFLKNQISILCLNNSPWVYLSIFFMKFPA